VVRPHWLVLLRPVLLGVLLLFIPVVVLVVMSANELAPFEGTARAVVAVLVPAYYLSVVTWLFVAWLDYYLDVGVVTDQRVVDTDQRGLFQRKTSELEAEMIQDVSAQRHGLLQLLFNFGDVIIQTAGERPNFTFTAIPKPMDFVKTITETYRIRKEGDAAQGVDVPTPARPQPDSPSPPVKPAAPPPAPPPTPPAADQSPPAPGDLPREHE
jgi:uncharacterized membrane protein YdbT with pleckstrin-like domain